MKVTLSVCLTAVIVLLCQMSSYVSQAKPMFGTGGMMKRKFPGTSEMSYNTYQGISRGNRQGEIAPVFVSRGGSSGTQFPANSDWMNTNNVNTALRSRSSIHKPATRHQSVQAVDYQSYPSSFSPRDSFAYLYFPQEGLYEDQYQKFYPHHY